MANLSSKINSKHFLIIALVLIFALIGSYLLFSSKAASTLTADFNSDNTVNIFDLSVLATNWNRTSATKAMGDTNSDGIVNIFDLSTLASQWGQTITETVIADYYVSKAGSDSNDGSASRPWFTIQKAANSVTAGKIVSIGAGTYNERVTIPISASGSSGNTTKFITDGNVIVSQAFVINSDYTELDGFEITPGSSSITDGQRTVGQVQVAGNYNILKNLFIHDLVRGTGITIAVGKIGNTIDSCTITNPKQGGVGSSNDKLGPSYTTVKNTSISKWAGEVGLDTVGDHWTIDNVILRGVAASDYQNPGVQNGDGIWANNSSNNIIRNTRIYDIWSHNGFNYQHADCIQVWTNATGLIIENTIIGTWKPGGAENTPGPTMGIMLGTVSDGTTIDITIRNSLFLMGVAPNTHPTATGRTNGVINVTLVNNTFFSNYPELSNISKITARNNIFYSHRGLGGTLDSDYNAFLWNNWESGSSTINSGEGVHSLGRTFSTRLYASDIFVNPDVSAATNYGLNADFHPKGVLLKAGDSQSASSYDITGTMRGSMPSIGAYE